MAVLQLIFKGQDEVGTTSKQVADDIRDVGKAADEAKPKGQGFFGGMLQAASGFLAADIVSNIAGQVTDFAAEAFDAARGTQQLMASTQQTIDTMGNAAGRSAQEVADLAASLSDAAGKSLFGDDQIQQSSNLLLTFGEIKGETFDLATALSVDLAAALGGAPKDQAMMLGKALNDPTKGLTALGKAGLTFSEEQKAMIAALQEGGDMAGAQAIIIAELNKQVGGQAEAQAQAAGGMVQFQARMGEVGETLATAFLPILDQLANLLLEYVAPALETAATWLGENLPGAIEVVSSALDSVMAVFSTTGETSDELSGVLSFLGEVWTELSAIIDVATELINATVVPLFEAIGQFLAAHSEEITQYLSNAWTIIETVIKTVLAVIKGVITATLQIIKGDWSGAWETIKQTLATVWSGIKTIVAAALDNLKILLSLAWDAIKGTVQTAWNNIKTAIASAWDGIKSTVTGKIDELVAGVKALPGQVAGVGAAIVQSIWDGIRGKWDELVNWFNDKLQELKDQLPFSEPKDPSSPLRGLARAGQALVENIQQGIEGATPLSVGGPLIGGRQASGGQLSGRAALGVGGSGGMTTIRVLIDDHGSDWLRKFINIQIDNRFDRAGSAALSRILTGG